MNTSHRHSLWVISSLAVLLALGACDRYDNRTVGQQADTATSKMARAARNVGDETKSMGAAGASKVEDGLITTKVNAALAADKDLSAVKIDVDTKNGVVTLTGPAPSAAARDRASEIAKNVKGVTSVNNQLAVKAG